MMPDNMTIKQAMEAGYLNNYDTIHKSLFDILGMEKPQDVYDRNGIHRSRFSPMYKKWNGYKLPKRINKIFWVGVKEGSRLDYPIKRNMTSCYSQRPVFSSGSKLLFDMNEPVYSIFPSTNLYEIPICEEWALQDY